MPQICLIAAVAENDALGKDGRLLCRLPDDMHFFQQTTWGYPLIMGRKTFESLPNGVLPGRLNIVLTRNADFRVKDGKTVLSLDEALMLCADADKVFIIGGESVYRAAMPQADVLLITRIHHVFENADVFFPQIDSKQWTKVSEIFHTDDAEHPYSFSFMKFEKK